MLFTNALQPMNTTVEESYVGWKLRFGQGSSDARDENLTAMSGGFHPGRTVGDRTMIVRPARFFADERFAGMHSNSNPQDDWLRVVRGRPDGPLLVAEQTLHFHRPTNGIRRGGE